MPLGPPPVAENSDTLPSGATREQRLLRISVRITDPSGMATGPSGKPRPVARIRTSLIVSSVFHCPRCDDRPPGAARLQRAANPVDELQGIAGQCVASPGDMLVGPGQHQLLAVGGLRGENE